MPLWKKSVMASFMRNHVSPRLPFMPILLSRGAMLRDIGSLLTIMSKDVSWVGALNEHEAGRSEHPS